MKKYILNSAVITSPGSYSYRHITVEEAKEWLSRGGWESTIGYEETALALQKITGYSIPVNRKVITMDVGDIGLVFRLVFPKGYRPDPQKKGQLGAEFIIKHSELGLLKRIA